MKFFVIALLVVIAVYAQEDEEKYTTKYDGIDLEEILRSERLFTNYYKCLMDQGKCTPDGRELKRVLPDALKTKCSKCSERQKQGTDRVLRWIIDEKPEAWKELSKKYDPDGVYMTTYKAEAEARGIKIPEGLKNL